MSYQQKSTSNIGWKLEETSANLIIYLQNKDYNPDLYFLNPINIIFFSSLSQKMYIYTYDHISKFIF